MGASARATIKRFDNPDGLADALAKLEAWSAQRPYERPAPATAHLFIVNPLRGAFRGLLSTHPPIEDRIARLHELDGRMHHRWMRPGSTSTGIGGFSSIR